MKIMIELVGKIEIGPLVELASEREKALYELGVMIERLTMYKHFVDTPDEEIVNAIENEIFNLQTLLNASFKAKFHRASGGKRRGVRID